MINFREDIKGVILAGGAGTRLFPLTKVTSKQLLPVYDRPMIFYPLSLLVNSGIRNIMVITTPEDQSSFKKLLNDGSQWDINIEYATQDKPEGIAQALIISEQWVNNLKTILILGDNLFFGPNINNIISKSIDLNSGATIFGYEVDEPKHFGVIEFDQSRNIVSIEEKPKNPKSNWAVTGLYIYDEKVGSYAKDLKKSDRGELEITDINNIYLDQKKLNAELLDKNYSWLDTGTFDSLLKASNYVKEFQKESNNKILEI